MRPRDEPPDLIAHKLVTNTGAPVRVSLQDDTLTVPTEPYRRGTPPTVELPVSHFDAVIERADVVDGGRNIAGFGGLHLPASEWERTGLERHWNADAAVGEPFSNTDRRLEVWASREDAFVERDPEEWSFDHLEAIPPESPLIREWDSAGDGPSRPPVPLSRPTLTLSVLHAKDSNSRTNGFDRLEVGRIAGVEILDDLEEWPEEPAVESLEIDPTPPPRHPELDYEALEALPWTDDVLEAVHVINRHAKRFDNDADNAYQLGDGAQARVSSLRKKALYRTKTVAIHRLVKAAPDRTRVARHELNGATEMYCFDFDDEYSFHQPLAAVADDLLEELGADDLRTESIDFEPSVATGDLQQSLADALCRLAGHGLDANDYLDATVVEDYDWGDELSTTFDCLD